MKILLIVVLAQIPECFVRGVAPPRVVEEYAPPVPRVVPTVKVPVFPVPPMPGKKP